ncbi:MAG TPA: glycosyltransferase family 39 protein [Elusimicrobiota bacterium]|nr:glycosyltransferase family 39 protein [Elusimicrobiota bacterium]
MPTARPIHTPHPDVPPSEKISPAEGLLSGSLARGLEISLFLLMLSFFLASVFYRFDSPGMIRDQLLDEVRGHHMAQQLRAGQPLLETLDIPFPLYHGSLISYLMMPFFYFVGPSWTLVRAWAVGAGLLALILSHLFLRRAFSPAVALLTLFLLVVHPPFIMGIKMVNYTAPTLLVFSLGALLLFQNGWRTRNPLYFFLGTACLSGGIGMRLWFAWFIGALAGSALVFSGPIRRHFDFPRSRNLLLSLGLGGLAFLPWLSLTLRTELSGRWDSFSLLSWVYLRPLSILSRASHAASADALWDPLFRAAAEVFHSFNANFFQGRFYFSYIFSSDAPVTNTYYPFLFWTCLALLLFLLLQPKNFPLRPQAGRLVVFFILLYLQLFTLYKEPLHHTYLFYPFPQLIVVVALSSLFALVRRRTPLLCLLLPFLGLFLIQEFRSLRNYYVHIRDFGGRGPATDSVYALATWMEKNLSPKETVLVSEEFLGEHLYFLCPDFKTSPPLFPFRVMDDAHIKLSITSMWQNTIKTYGAFIFINGVYVKRSTYFLPIDLFDHVPWSAKDAPELLASFRDRDGHPTFDVYRFKETAHDRKPLRRPPPRRL